MAMTREMFPPSGVLKMKKRRPGDTGYIKPKVEEKEGEDKNLPLQQKILRALPRSLREAWYNLVIGYVPRLHAEAVLKATLIRADGSVVDYGVVSRRLVTTAFRDAIVGALAGGAAYSAFADFKYHDSGTGSTAEANNQTALVTPTGVARAEGTQVDAAPIYRSVATITYNDTYSITEHGLFNASSSGVLMDRSVFSGIDVDENDQITFTYEITFSAES